jgi:hypothetical protein
MPGMGVPSVNLDAVRDEHRRWLGRHGLLDRPWLVLGSAPEPTLPKDLVRHSALICINSAGATAARLGLPPADLTIRNKKKDWSALTNCKVPVMLWLCDRHQLAILWTRLIRKTGGLGEIRTMGRYVRRAVDFSVLGDGTAEEPRSIGKTSTGVFAAIYAQFVGVPGVALAGMSIDKQGYSYDSPPQGISHVAEDLFALRRIAERYPSIRTTETVIADSSGIPLIHVDNIAAPRSRPQPPPLATALEREPVAYCPSLAER